jgi:hypothetical protein
MWAVKVYLRSYPRGKGACYPLSRGLGEPEDQYRRSREEKNLLPLLEIEPRFFGRTARNLITILNPRIFGFDHKASTVLKEFDCQWCSARTAE